MHFIFIYLFVLLKCYNGFVIENDIFGEHCRDGGNRPVAWWYIYKPPAGVVHPSGQNFSFLTPDSDGRWLLSPYGITEAFMLDYTLKPNDLLENHAGRAMTIFESRIGDVRSSARGVVMAGSEGGFLLMHSVPGFPHRHNSLPLFPLDELENGHLLACVSLGFDALKKVARAIKEVSPNITYSHMPKSLARRLPGWNFDKSLSPIAPLRLRPSIYSLIRANDSVSRYNTKPVIPIYLISNGPIDVVLVARPPGVKSCIYSSFAARQLVMLNVYGQSRSAFLTTMCSKGFGVRNIDSLCLKYEGPEGPGSGSVYYVPANSTDRSWFAVSTAAAWQQRGRGSRQYWVCTSLVDKEDVAGEGGMLLCVQNYGMWVAFDNLKIAEPSCD